MYIKKIKKFDKLKNCCFYKLKNINLGLILIKKLKDKLLLFLYIYTSRNDTLHKIWIVFFESREALHHSDLVFQSASSSTAFLLHQFGCKIQEKLFF